MPRPTGRHDFVYVHTDIPAGLTIRQWRAQRAGERRAAEEVARELRRRRVRATFMRRWITAWRVLPDRVRLVSREVRG
jgi:hypothetical protein